MTQQLNNPAVKWPSIVWFSCTSKYHREQNCNNL